MSYVSKSHQNSKSRFTSYREYQAALDRYQNALNEDFASNMQNVNVPGNVRKRIDMLNQSTANIKNPKQIQTAIWDVLNNSNIDPVRLMQIVRSYIQQYRQNKQNKQNQDQDQDQQGV